LLSQDTNAKNQALRDIEDSSEKMEKEKAKVEEFEASLVAEEKILEGIRDSLKGLCHFHPFARTNLIREYA
jgi:structural maintenance of chromosome 4